MAGQKLPASPENGHFCGASINTTSRDTGGKRLLSLTPALLCLRPAVAIVGEADL